jgi:hypothetical protein
MKIKLFNLTLLFISFVYGFSEAQSFSLVSNGSSIPVWEQNDVPLSYSLNTYKYSRVVYTGKPLLLEIETSGFEFDNTEWDISPHSYGLQGKKQNSKLSFTINRTGYVVVRFSKNQDFTKRLVIFVEPPERLPVGEIINVVESYNVDNSGLKNETQKIQKALNEISGTNKVLYFPEGKYKTFMLQIKSNSKIHLAKNSRIIADASELNSYIAKKGKGINRFILIEDASNIHVTGLGAFDGNGSEILGVVDSEKVRELDGMRLLFMLNSKNISFDGILLKDSARWNTHFVGCQDITFRNCKMINNLINNEFFGSLDGWDPDSSKRVLIEDCFGWAGDDNVAIKSTGYGDLNVYDNVEDITVRGCVFLTKKTALKIGTETRCESYKRILFEDIDVIEADRVMGINVRDRAVVDGVLFKDIRSEFSFPDRRTMPINVYITRREDDQPWTGKIKNVVFENCSFEKKFPNKIQISRLENYTEPKDIDVTFKNLTISGKKITFLDPDYFNVSKCNGLIKFK